MMRRAGIGKVRVEEYRTNQARKEVEEYTDQGMIMKSTGQERVVVEECRARNDLEEYKWQGRTGRDKSRKSTGQGVDWEIKKTGYTTVVEEYWASRIKVLQGEAGEKAPRTVNNAALT